MSHKLDYFFNLQYLGQYLSYYIQTWHDVRRVDALYAHAITMTLAFMQGHSGSAKVKKSALHALGY